MDRFRGVQAFVSVVDAGSFTGAAQVLGVSKSWVSKELSRLEERLGTTLLDRTTRRIRLTEVGAAFHTRCSRVLEELEEAEDVVLQSQRLPRGVLRASVPVSFGVRTLTPVASELLNRCPDLQVDLRFSDRRVDLLADGFDLAIRIGHLEDSSLTARRLASSQRVVVASPAYVERQDKPQHPTDLSQHACLLYGYQQTGASWILRGPSGDRVVVPVSGRWIADNGDALLEAACAGLGCVYLPDFIVRDAMTEGRVVRVLPDWSETTPVWALTPPGRYLSPKVRVFIDALSEHLLDGSRWGTVP